MKKLFLVILIVSISSSYAQFLNGYGVKVGGTLSRQTWEYSVFGGFDFAKDNKIGFNIGAFAELFDSPFISFVGEINYIQKGFQEEVMTRSPSGYAEESFWLKMRFDYINISLFAKPKIKLGILSPYLIVGPRIDFEIGKSSNYSIDKLYDDFTKNMIGLKVGVGSEIEVCKYRLLAEVLYDINISELYKNPNLKVKAYSIDFTIGLYL